MIFRNLYRLFWAHPLPTPPAAGVSVGKVLLYRKLKAATDTRNLKRVNFIFVIRQMLSLVGTNDIVSSISECYGMMLMQIAL